MNYKKHVKYCKAEITNAKVSKEDFYSLSGGVWYVDIVSSDMIN